MKLEKLLKRLDEEKAIVLVDNRTKVETINCFTTLFLYGDSKVKRITTANNDIIIILENNSL